MFGLTVTEAASPSCWSLPSLMSIIHFKSCFASWCTIKHQRGKPLSLEAPLSDRRSECGHGQGWRGQMSECRRGMT